MTLPADAHALHLGHQRHQQLLWSDPEQRRGQLVGGRHRRWTSTSSYNVFTGNMVMQHHRHAASAPTATCRGMASGSAIRTTTSPTTSPRTSTPAAATSTAMASAWMPKGCPTTSLIPAYQGDDPSQPGQSTSVCMNAIPLLDFSGNEVYGATARGFSTWWLGTVFESPRRHGRHPAQQRLLVPVRRRLFHLRNRQPDDQRLHRHRRSDAGQQRLCIDGGAVLRRLHDGQRRGGEPEHSR